MMSGDWEEVDTPNKPMDRTYRPQRTAVLHKKIVSLHVDKNDRILVGSTNPYASHWEGSMLLFDNYEKFKANDSRYFCNGEIMFDGKIMEDLNLMLISENPGYLKLLSIPNDTENSLWQDNYESKSNITSISLLHSSNKFATLSSSKLTFFEISYDQSFNVLKDYENYHINDMVALAVKPESDNFAITSGLDRMLISWDNRLERAGQLFYTHDFATIMSLSWNPANLNEVAAGSEAGDLYLFDIRQPKEFTTKCVVSKQPVRYLSYSVKGSLGVSGKFIYDSNLKLVKTVSDVEGVMCWHDQILYSSEGNNIIKTQI